LFPALLSPVQPSQCLNAEPFTGRGVAMTLLANARNSRVIQLGIRELI
jgi:hypothetical protein